MRTIQLIVESAIVVSNEPLMTPENCIYIAFLNDSNVDAAGAAQAGVTATVNRAALKPGASVSFMVPSDLYTLSEIPYNANGGSLRVEFARNPNFPG
jgi:hypothetical protein